MTTTTKTKRPVLRKLPDEYYGDPQWTVVGRPEFIITRRKWDLPISYVSYSIAKNGVTIDSDLPTLADVRDYLEDWE